MTTIISISFIACSDDEDKQSNPVIGTWEITDVYKRQHKMLGNVNKNLKLIAAQLNVDANMTTYVARHSFASVLKKSGVSIASVSYTHLRFFPPEYPVERRYGTSHDALQTFPRCV